MIQLAFFEFSLVKHNILTLKENTIKSFINFAVQKMPNKDCGTDILAYKIHKDTCASNKYFQKKGGLKKFPVNLLTDVCQQFCVIMLCVQKHHMALQSNVFY